MIHALISLTANLSTLNFARSANKLVHKKRGYRTTNFRFSESNVKLA